MPLAHEESNTAQQTSGNQEIVSGNDAGTDQLYILAVAIYASSVIVDQVEGGGLTWNQLAGAIGCGGRIPQIRTELWWAFGSPGGTFDVTVDTDGSCRLSLVVSRYSGADPVTPVENADHANTNGASSPSCGGGSDNSLVLADITSTIADSMMYIASHVRHRTIDTADPSYTQRAAISNFSSGDGANLYVHDFLDSAIETDNCEHDIGGGDTDWAASVCAIRPLSSIPVPTQRHQMLI
jgi:hypothetical protein